MMICRSWMMMKIRMTGRGLLTGLLLVGAGTLLQGQRADFNSWYELNLEKRLGQRVDLEAEIEQRFNQNSTRYDRSLLTVSAGYQIMDILKVNGGGRVLMAADNEMHISPRYRFHADLRGRYKIDNLNLSLRSRMQYGFEEFAYFGVVRDNRLINRNRLKVSYHVFGTRIGLYTSAESWGFFHSVNDHFFKRIRYTAGVTYTTGFRSELGLRYILEDEFNQVDPLRSHILVLSYSHEL